MFSWYAAQLVRNPLATKSLTGMTLAGIGDGVAQRIELERGAATGFDRRRFLTFAAFGFVWTGPFNHVYLRYLTRAFPLAPNAPFKERMRTVARKLFVQHGLWNPLVYAPCYFAVYGIGMDLTRAQTAAKAKSEYVPILTATMLTWLPVTSLMFFFMAERYQSVFMSACSVFWNVSLSLYSGGSDHPESEAKTKKSFYEAVFGSSKDSRLNEDDGEILRRPRSTTESTPSAST